MEGEPIRIREGHQEMLSELIHLLVNRINIVKEVVDDFLSNSFLKV